MADYNEQKSCFAVRMLTNLGMINLDAKYIIELFFIEDIFSFSMMGKLRFIDKVGMGEFLPLTGHEKIGILYGVDPGSQVDVVFDIFSIDDVSGTLQAQGGSQQVFDITFVDTRYLNLTQKRFSYSWKNKLISDIVKDIDKNMLGFKSIYQRFEVTRETLENFYMPYWTPLETLRWLIKRGSGASTGQPGYLYYNNSKGLNFVTLENLFQNQEVEYDTNTKKILSYRFNVKDPDAASNKIISWSISHIDYQSLLGLKGGRRLGYNFATKALLDQSHTYKTSIANYTILGKKTLFPDYSEKNTKILLEGESQATILDNIHNDEFIKRYTKQLALMVNVEGHERRYAGMMADVVWPSSRQKEYMNKGFEGLFLVKSVTHQFSGFMTPPYRQKLVMVKTGYTDSDFKSLLPSSKINTTIKTRRIGGA
jgi:hypothetical protein